MPSDKQYTLGKGKVYFDRFPSNVVTASTVGEGEMFFGNCPGFTINTTSEQLDHYSSTGGIKEQDKSVDLSVSRTATISCDNISPENSALFLLGTATTLVQTSATGQVSAIVDAQRDRFYQLGVSGNTPAGVRKVTSVVVRDTVTPTPNVIAQVGNYEVDEELGRVYILADAPGINGIDLNITYNVTASTRSNIVSKNTTINGALRFLADNPEGTNLDYYMPHVKLTPNGDYSLISDDWMTMGFQLNILKKTATTEAVYADGRPLV